MVELQNFEWCVINIQSLLILLTSNKFVIYCLLAVIYYLLVINLLSTMKNKKYRSSSISFNARLFTATLNTSE